jgi:hypothetical protein
VRRSGVHVNTDNITISNNQIIYQEQGFKFHEAGGRLTLLRPLRTLTTTISPESIA